MKWIYCGLAIAAATFNIVAPVPLSAQLSYGSWQKTTECRPAKAPSGFNRGAINLPQAPGGSQAQECRWTRTVEDCPRIRDKLMHPIQCTRKKQVSDFTIQPPN